MIPTMRIWCVPSLGIPDTRDTRQTDEKRRKSARSFVAVLRGSNVLVIVFHEIQRSSPTLSPIRSFSWLAAIFLKASQNSSRSCSRSGWHVSFSIVPANLLLNLLASNWIAGNWSKKQRTNDLDLSFSDDESIKMTLFCWSIPPVVANKRVRQASLSSLDGASWRLFNFFGVLFLGWVGVVSEAKPTPERVVL